MSRIDWDTELEHLRRDNRSGAEEVTSRAVELLGAVVGAFHPRETTDYRQWLLRIGRELIAAQPSVGSLFRVVSDMLWACDESLNGEGIRREALAFLEGYRLGIKGALATLTELACDYLADYPVIMTYSCSSTVLRVLTALAKRGLEKRILCSEARPMLEGQIMASELYAAGLDVTLGVDMALFGWLSKATVLVLGADGLARSGMVNKIGTAVLAQAAFERNLPCFTLCTTHKFLPRDFPISSNLRAGESSEIMAASTGLTVESVYVDVTPLSLVSKVITEEGGLSGDPLTNRLGLVRTYPGLCGK